MASEIERYACGMIQLAWGGAYPTHLQRDGGDWVRYVDHAAEVEALRARLARIEPVYEAAMAMYHAQMRNYREYSEPSGAELNTAWERLDRAVREAEGGE